jgi:uronate dehydrogenase
MSTYLVTGASGHMGTLLRPLLVALGHRLVLLDVAPLPVACSPGESFPKGSLTDADLLARLCAGVDLIVHLGGYRSERSWSEIVDVNITGTQVVLEAARHAGVQRVLLASSLHATGFLPVEDAAADPVPAPRPDTYYGVGKVAIEALGSLYADRFAMAVVSARIMTFEARPSSERSRSTWFSPADAVRLIEAAAQAGPGHHVVWGVSNNSRRWVSLIAGEQMGFRPADDAEKYFDQAAREDDAPRRSGEMVRLGGPFTEVTLGRARP